LRLFQRFKGHCGGFAGKCNRGFFDSSAQLGLHYWRDVEECNRADKKKALRIAVDLESLEGRLSSR